MLGEREMTLRDLEDLIFEGIVFVLGITGILGFVILIAALFNLL